MLFVLGIYEIARFTLTVEGFFFFFAIAAAKQLDNHEYYRYYIN